MYISVHIDGTLPVWQYRINNKTRWGIIHIAACSSKEDSVKNTWIWKSDLQLLVPFVWFRHGLETVQRVRLESELFDDKRRRRPARRRSQRESVRPQPGGHHQKDQWGKTIPTHFWSQWLTVNVQQHVAQYDRKTNGEVQRNGFSSVP